MGVVRCEREISAMMMNRRQFIAFAATSAGAGICGGCIFGRVLPARAEPCVTSSDVLGPFYRLGAPERTDLRVSGEPGIHLHVHGTVRGTECSIPLSGAVLDVWHCDAGGSYDQESKEYRHRATIRTDKRGEYRFVTVMPGRYYTGGTHRPAHIHFKVSVPNHDELVTQLYFLGDPFLEKDPFSS